MRIIIKKRKKEKLEPLLAVKKNQCASYMSAAFFFWNRSFWWRPFLLCKTMMLFLGNLMAFLSSSVLRSQLMIHWHPSFFCLFVYPWKGSFDLFFERKIRERKSVYVCLKNRFFETEEKKNYYPTIFLYPTKFIQWPARDRWCSVFKKVLVFLSWNSIEEKKKKIQIPL